MAGTLYLGGGGSAADEAELWHAMLPAHRRVLYWPLALAPDRRAAAADWLTGSFRSLGGPADVEPRTDLPGHRPEEFPATTPRTSVENPVAYFPA